MPAQTPLDRLIRERVRAAGPLRLDLFMELALAHPAHGYYMNRDPLGVAGDFTTAPEISQMFGELLGLWAADVWSKLGRPPQFQLIECGPGRGTLMADALRAGARVTGFVEAAKLVLIEISPVLRARQRAALSRYEVTWLEGLDDPAVGGSDGPVVLLANEFLDALPIRQFKYTDDAWCECFVAANANDDLFYSWQPHAGMDPADRAQPRLAALDRNLCKEADIFEMSDAVTMFAEQIGALLNKRCGAALFIDYGYIGPAAGETLQALRGHASVSPLTDVGEADLTAHVDFGALAASARSATVHGAVEQGIFLRRLGIEARAAILRPNAPEAVDAALRRLTAPSRMGALFKVMALSHGLFAPPEGF